jgi:hypothetical protein
VVCRRPVPVIIELSSKGRIHVTRLVVSQGYVYNVKASEYICASIVLHNPAERHTTRRHLLYIPAESVTVVRGRSAWGFA